MPISFTDYFNVNKDDFSKTGAFDVILDVDSRVFIDPAVIRECTIEEFTNSKDKIESYFSDIILLLTHSTDENDMYWNKAERMLTFKELKGNCFGYSNRNTNGNAIGPILRKQILRTVKELIDVGETNPRLFELLGVFQEGVGCDRISDLLTFILTPEILLFTQKILEQFDLCHSTLEYNGIIYNTAINKYNDNPILLLPSKVLSPLPIAYFYDDIDFVCAENERVRNAANEYYNFGGRRKVTKREIFNLMKNVPSFREIIINKYNNQETVPYDFEKDPIGEYIWYEAAKEYIEKYPLELSFSDNPSIDEVASIVTKICNQYRALIEKNGLWSLLYDDNGKKKHERSSQLLFYGIADQYCNANNIDLSREPNAGRGSVDFKLSRGSDSKVLVEIKLTSNKDLVHGFTTQVPIYMSQENTNNAIYLIVDNGHEERLQNFIKVYNEQSKDVKKKIQYIIVDAIPKKSASIA